MQIDIPRQLERPEFRFVLVQERAKRPVEGQWTTINNYRFDRPKLQDWLAKRRNYGVCCGYGSLVVVDSDDSSIAERSQEKLGVTFRGAGAVSPRESIVERTDEPYPWQGCTRPLRLAYITANGNALPCFRGHLPNILAAGCSLAS